MANTYSQIYIQVIFAVKNRDSLIELSWEENLFQYITGTVQKQGQKMIAINGISNHIHLFIGMKPNCLLSDLIRDIKRSSSDFINENKLSKFKFNWQEGYGAFSYSNSQIDTIFKYIMNQKEHHKKITFKEEYHDFLEKFQIEYEEKYLFDWI